MQLPMAMLIVIFVCCVLFIFFDVWYFIRFTYVFFVQRSKKRNIDENPLEEEDLYKEYVTSGIVLLSDLDMYMHMNNSKYGRECDFGRVGMYIRSGMKHALNKHHGRTLVNAINIRYRRPMHLFQCFDIYTSILCWEDNALYLEQKVITTDGFVTSIALVKMAIRGVSCSEVISAMCGGKKVVSRKLSPELKSWQDSILQSSKRLKQELASKSN